jgi:hypothetical protein
MRWIAGRPRWKTRAMGEDDVPVLVFSGPYEDVLFLKTLIESAGIETSLDAIPQRRHYAESRLFVRPADARDASEIVADFRTQRDQSDT